jgi:hypothetical protein
MDIAKLSRKIGRAGELTDIGYVATFTGRRRTTDGRTRQVTVEIHDDGVMAPPGTRYTVTARQRYGLEAKSAQSDSIESALRTFSSVDFDHPTQVHGFRLTPWG